MLDLLSLNLDAERTSSIYKGHTVGEVIVTALADDSEGTADSDVESFVGKEMKIPFKVRRRVYTMRCKC
jgi:hypothetical protein